MSGLLLVTLPFLLAPGRCGTSVGGFFSGDPAPDMRGDWEVTYDNVIGVEIDIGGSTYTGTVGVSGGSFQFVHDGQPVDLALDCSRKWVVCPSEVWANEVAFDQPRFDLRPHQVEMSVVELTCSDPRMPDEQAGECSSDPAENKPCDVEICDDANMTQTTKKAIASISNPVPAAPVTGSTPAYTIGIALSGGIAVPTANCVLLAGSYADADIVYDGSYDPEEPTMVASDLADGLVTIDVAGACLWGTEQGGNLAAALLGARVRLTTGFTARKK
jgi:hypothetical protein